MYSYIASQLYQINISMINDANEINQSIISKIAQQSQKINILQSLKTAIAVFSRENGLKYKINYSNKLIK